MDLFEHRARQAALQNAPLAERIRPRMLKDFYGQRHLVAPGKILHRSIENQRLFSMILWGPPGCGKTTLARILAREMKAHFAQFSAVLSGVKEIRAVIKEALDQRKRFGRQTILFVDEIHRFNKAQQDAFLHQVESGLLTLIGATTENPSFEVIPALMSRCRILRLDPLEADDLVSLLTAALHNQQHGLGRYGVQVDREVLHHLVRHADGDARYALNALEIAVHLCIDRRTETTGPDISQLSLALVEEALQQKALTYDKSGEEHFNLISALHKSMRGSDPDAALYWLGRMLQAGEDPLYIVRRLVRFASEDIGLADPQALAITINAQEAVHFIGMPEGELAVAQAVLYLATAPKSNRIYKAYGQVKRAIVETGSLPVPLHIRNAPTALTKAVGYGRGYKYPPDHQEHFVNQQYMPDGLCDRRFYEPTNNGFETRIKARMQKWEMMRQRLRQKSKGAEPKD